MIEAVHHKKKIIVSFCHCWVFSECLNIFSQTKYWIWEKGLSIIQPLVLNTVYSVFIEKYKG